MPRHKSDNPKILKTNIKLNLDVYHRLVQIQKAYKKKNKLELNLKNICERIIEDCDVGKLFGIQLEPMPSPPTPSASPLPPPPSTETK